MKHLLAFLIFSQSFVAILLADTNSLADQALASASIRQNLITGYEVSPGDFRNERLLAVAISYATEKRWSKAESVYQTLLRDSPNNTRGLRGLASCYWDDGRVEKAIPYLKKAWSLGDIDSLVPLGACYLATRNYDQMEALVPELLKEKHRDTDVVSCLLAYALTTDPPKEELISQAIDALPDKEVLARDDIAHQLATAVERLEKLSETEATAQKIFRKTIRGYVADKQSWPKVRLCAVGDAYFFLGERSHAQDIYNEVLLTQPDNSDAHIGLGLVALCDSNYSRTITYCRKAWSSGNQRALSPLAAAYLMAHDLTGMADLVPSLFSHRTEDVQILNSLIGYSLIKVPKDRELFFQSIKGIPETQILRRQDTTEAVAAGLRAFGENKRADHLLKLKRKQDNGLSG